MIKSFKPTKNFYQVLAVLAVIMVFLIMPVDAAAQVDSKLKEVGVKVKAALDVVVGILILAGAAIVFFKYKSGDPGAKNQLIMLIIGGAVYYSASAIAGVFGLTIP